MRPVTTRTTRVHWMGVGAGLTVVYGTATLVTAPLLWYWMSRQDDLGGPFQLLIAFASSVFGRVSYSAALAVGVIAGAYAAMTYSRSDTIVTGVVVGGVVSAIKIALAVPLLLGLQRAGSLVDIALSVALVFFAYLGALLGRRRTAAWQRECDALDSWRRRSPNP